MKRKEDIKYNHTQLIQWKFDRLKKKKWLIYWTGLTSELCLSKENKESSRGKPLQNFSDNLEIVDRSTPWAFEIFWKIWYINPQKNSGKTSEYIKNCLNYSSIKNCKNCGVAKLCGLITPVVQKREWSYLIVGQGYKWLNRWRGALYWCLRHHSDFRV